MNTNADLAGVTLEPLEGGVRGMRIPGSGAIGTVADAIVQEIGGITLRQLATLHAKPDHPLARMIDAECSQGCGTPIRVMRLFAARTACDPCREKAEKAERMERARTYWETLCPPQFRDTDRAHPEFPRAQYADTADFNGAQSLFLIGPTRKGKTRLAVLLLKRCLVRYNQHVGILWPEELKQVRANNVNRLEWVHKWGRYDVLLWDDSLLTGAQDERITDALKDLLDYRLRWKRANIFTSQIGGGEFKGQADKYADKATSADMKRIDALLARLREACRVIAFTGGAAQAKGEEETQGF